MITARLAGLAGVFLVVGLIAVLASGPARAGGDDSTKGPTLVQPDGPSLVISVIDTAKGRRLFATKGCVICHSVNGIGGPIAPSLDAVCTPPYANPFDFAARMLRGAEAMIALQKQDLGHQIELTGEELGHIIGFAHDHQEQQKFSEDDITPRIRKLMHSQRL
jgi:cytochrome c